MRILATPDQQISLTDPDARSMAASGRGPGVVGYNVQIAVDTEHHLIITHEVSNVGTDGSQLALMAKETKATLEAENLDVVARTRLLQQRGDPGVRGGRYHSHAAKANELELKAEGRFGQQDLQPRPVAEVPPFHERLLSRRKNHLGLMRQRFGLDSRDKIGRKERGQTLNDVEHCKISCSRKASIFSPRRLHYSARETFTYRPGDVAEHDVLPSLAAFHSGSVPD